MTTTTYIIRINGVQSEKTYGKKDRAVAVATEAFENGARVVTVHTASGTEVFTAAKAKVGAAAPYTRLVTLRTEHLALVPLGYAPAYERRRNGAVVLRRENDIPEDPERYAVLDTTNGLLAGFGGTTRHVGQIMKSLKAQHIISQVEKNIAEVSAALA